MKIHSLSILATLALATPSIAKADRLQPVVDASVTSVVFDAGTNTRAVAGGSEQPFLAIERIHRGRVSDQTWISELPIGRAMVPLGEFKNLRLVSLEGATLVFELAPRMKGARRAIQCTSTFAFDNRRVQLRGTSCTQDNKPYTHGGEDEGLAAPQQNEVTTEDIKSASKACDAAFAFPSDRKKCVDMTIDGLQAKTKFASSAVKVVNACAQGFAFPSSRTWCIETASRSTREPVELIRFCTEQNTFESEQKACLTKFTKTP